MPRNKRLCEERKEMEECVKSLKKQVDDALAKQHEAMTRAVTLAKRNQQLMKELKTVDRLALCVEKECSSSLKDNAEKISKAQAELDDNFSKLQLMESKVNDLIGENQILKRKNCELEKKRKEAKEAFLDALQEKDQMLTELRAEEEELCQKIEKMSRTLENQKQRIMDLESELAECRGNQQKLTSRSKGTKISKCQNTQKSQPKSSKSQQNSPKYSGRQNSANRYKDANNSECTCCSMGGSYPKEHGNSRGSHSKIIKIHSESPLSHLTLQLVGRNTDNCEGSRSSSEEEEMTDMNSDNSSQMSEEEVQVINMKENKCQGDIIHSRPPTPFRLSSAEAVISRLKRERDIAKCDVERLQAEILALRKRLEAATDVQMQEKCRYEKCLAKEEEKIRRLQMECDDLHKYQSSLCSKVQGQEESITKLMRCLDAVKEELEREQCINRHLKKLVDQKTEDLNSIEQECRRKKNEVDQLEKCNSQQREKYIAAESQLIAMRKGVGRIVREMEKLERENIRLWTEILEQEDDYDQMKGELYDKVVMVDKLMKKFSALQEDLARSKHENKTLLANVTDMCSKINNSDAEIRRLEDEVKNVTCVVGEYEQQVCCLNQKIDELQRIRDLQEKKRAELEAHLSATHKLCERLQSEIKTKDAAQDTPRSEKNMECQVRHLQKEVNMLKRWNVNLLEVLESIDQVLASKGNESFQHESSKQELRNELLRLCKSIQEVKKQLYPNSFQSSRSKRIPPIEEESDPKDDADGCVEDDPPQQRAAKNVVTTGRKVHQFTVLSEPTRRPEKCPQQKQHESRQAHATVKGSSASPRMRHKKECIHSVRKLTVKSRESKSPRDNCKQPERSNCKQSERSNCSPRGGSVKGRHDKVSPRGKSSSPGSKIHVHANIASGSFVNVELQDDDGSGEDYYSNHSTGV